MNRFVAPARSLGVKLILVGALAFVLWIPCLMIYALVWERSSRADSVRSEIHELAGGEQTISGPIIIVPAIVDTGKKTALGEPVTRRIEGSFGPFSPPVISDGVATCLWSEARLAIKFSSDIALKGVKDTPKLAIGGKSVDAAFEPGIAINIDNGNIYAPASGVSVATPIADPASGFQFRIDMPVSGGGSLNFSPVGEKTHATLASGWPHPSFRGARMPNERTIGADGFTADWRVPYLARGLPRSFIADPGLVSLESGKSFGVSFVSTDSPYQSVNRALKYALMFDGIVFLTFFLIEATMGGRAHPAQYILLGLAQVVLYLLVLSFAEHIGFETAFIGAASATVLLSGLYAATVFRSIWRGIIAFLAFSGAYGLIYLLMKSEDYALLIGSVAAFGAVALTMTVTRNLDWYGARIAEERV